MSDYDDAKDLELLATRVNGFVYHGDRLNALVDTVEALRKDPELAARLLGFKAQEEWAYRYKGPRMAFTGQVPTKTREEAEDTKTVFLENYSDIDGVEAQVLSRKVWTSDWEEVGDGPTG